jgi:hypothetical protein
MKLTDELEALILEQLQAHPDRALVLPDWCYWKGQSQPTIYVEGLPTRLSRHLYEKVIGPLEYGQTLHLRDGIHPKNVNPYLFIAQTGRKRGERCPNGHLYAGNEMPDNSMGWRCRTCYLSWRSKHSDGGQNVGEINAAKTHCPKRHAYDAENTLHLRNGRRRCRRCNAEQSRKYYENRRAS